MVIKRINALRYLMQYEVILTVIRNAQNVNDNFDSKIVF